MRYLSIFLAVILCCTFLLSACGGNDVTDSTESENDLVVGSNQYENIKTLLQENTQTGKTAKVCSPIYFKQLKIEKEKMEVCNRGVWRFDAAIFPVLEDKKPVGFIMLQYEDENLNDPDKITDILLDSENSYNMLFMPISDSAYKKLKKRHTLKIAMAQWKVGRELYELAHIYFSDDNEAGYLADNLKELGVPQKTPPIEFEYDELPELQSFDLKSLDVIMTFENE